MTTILVHRRIFLELYFKDFFKAKINLEELVLGFIFVEHT